MVFIQVGNSLVKLWTPLTFINREVEKVDVGIQRKLVHRVNTTHVIQNKEEDGCSLSTWAIPLKATTNHENELLTKKTIINWKYVHI